VAQERTSSVAVELPTPTPLQELTSEKQAAEDLLAAQTAQISRLQKEISIEQRDLAGLRSALHGAENQSSELSAANSKEEAELRQVSEERDKLSAQLRDTEKAYQLLQAEFTTLRTEHDRALVHTASLESKIEELSSTTRDQDRRLKDDEQYLTSDRDIRELMGARKLYIADVFDVDSGSRTRKAFGRVFYTQNKSLIFYAFDLDRQPGVKNASAFQVWGQRDSESGAKSHPMNLGILYMDSESNRRWVLRWDDPKQLAEIDAVFVTVEPHGGSQKPTGKPFLYALLRKEANHP
jgi:predicted  nucleic acid-binding Zn-ribbon protein